MLVIAVSIFYGYANIAIWKTQTQTEAHDNADTRQNVQAS
jgi:NhaC family Na+:H+ antiporter